jgi:hypothetical protein
MKEFDLKAALAGHPIETVDGVKVLDLHFFDTSNSWAKLYGVTKYGDVLSWSVTGSFGPKHEDYPTMNLVLSDI